MKIKRNYLNSKSYSNKRFKQVKKVLHKIKLKRNDLIFNHDLEIDNIKVTRLKNSYEKIYNKELFQNSLTATVSYKDDTNYMM